MIFESSSCARIPKELAALMQKKATGEWLVSSTESGNSSKVSPRERSPKANPDGAIKRAGDRENTASNPDSSLPRSPTSPHQQREWRFYLYEGRLLYATESNHRVRRWSRGLRQHCPDFAVDPKRVPDREPWEYQLLLKGIQQGAIAPVNAKAVIRTSALEVFFNLASSGELTTHWNGAPTESFDISLNLSLSGVDVRQAIEKAQKFWQQWQDMGLNYICPDLAPVLSNPSHLKKQVSSKSFLALNNLFNGDNTLWDLAIQRKESAIAVTRTLDHFIQQGKIALQQVPDWPSPIEQWQMIGAAIPSSQRLIACIDDSPMIAESLEQILRPAGYNLLKIQDPMHGVALLAEKKPDLIFLDVVMPQTNGYNLCTFLRQSTLFRNTPIIILTSQNSIIDRTRAKLIGASDFLSKPPEPQQVLQLVEKYLQPSSQPDVFPIGYPAMA